MKKVIFYSLLLVTFFAATGFKNLTQNAKKGEDPGKGYYYAYAYQWEGNKRKIIFSTIFHISSKDRMSGANEVLEKYKAEKGFNGGGIKGPFKEHDVAVKAKDDEKITFRVKRFLVNTDAGFMGVSF